MNANNLEDIFKGAVSKALEARCALLQTNIDSLQRELTYLQNAQHQDDVINNISKELALSITKSLKTPEYIISIIIAKYQYKAFRAKTAYTHLVVKAGICITVKEFTKILNTTIGVTNKGRGWYKVNEHK